MSRDEIMVLLNTTDSSADRQLIQDETPNGTIIGLRTQTIREPDEEITTKTVYSISRVINANMWMGKVNRNEDGTSPEWLLVFYNPNLEMWTSQITIKARG